MIQLTPNECRVLGVLIEKAQTTPGQYPLSLNGLTTGCNQKSNRNPAMNLSEEVVLDTLDELRAKQLAREVSLSGSRVAKYRHVAREGLEVDTNQLVILAELMLRGPQTVGELRGRATRMHPIETLDIANNVLQSLMDREEPMVRKIAPVPGSRAERYLQLICPSLHHVTESEGTSRKSVTQGDEDNSTTNINSDFDDRLKTLEQDVADLKNAITRIEAALGNG